MRLPWASSVILVAVLALAGCGGTEPESGPDATSGPDAATSPATATESPSASPTATESEPAGPAVEITVENGTVSPSGERIEVAIGEPVTFTITSDTAGEFHVHSTPEQHLAFGEGTTTQELTFDTPGIVEVESHDPHQVVVQLQVQ